MKALVCCLLLFVAGVAVAVACEGLEARNQLPMYGEGEKTPCMEQADAEFLETMRKQGLSREEASRQVLKLAWSYWTKGDSVTAMSRFNQAWLLNPDNGNVYHGFAIITADRGASADKVEQLFQIAASKAETAPVAFVDYGRFLWTQGQLDRSLTQLKKALELSPKARNARSNIAFVYYLKNEFSRACEWAKQARENGDKLEAGFLEEMCGRSDRR